MIERSAVVVLEQLKTYMAEWRELERQYYRLPSWRWIKQHRNVSKRMHLTRVFTARMKHWGVIE